MAPQTQKRWVVSDQRGFDDLKLETNAPVQHMGDSDVLVKFHGASLNYRDLIIANGKYPFASRKGVVPASDGAGVVEAVGSKVHLFKPGDKVVTLFNQGHIAGALDPVSATFGVGGTVDGGLQQYGVYHQLGVAPMPRNLDFLEGATLCCAGLTAWNAFYGIESKQLKPGEWVLTQGSGGVSVFAIQFAKSAGARVIATTSSDDKAKKLKELGADHVINYKQDSAWGQTAKKLTGGNGVQHIIEVGGPGTMKQSLEAVAREGVITIIGFLGGHSKDTPPMLDALTYGCIIRGIFVGSRAQLIDMGRSIEANNIKPVVDEKVFTLETTRDAYEYMWAQKHFGKVCIKID